ncbi:leucine-rich repeat and WD repeat-containing protein 1 [Osmerus eperlanus]|uniref:leucine-rich repeat and WD repeat-containing protein 1 n=1 Tax=Osmerus eperlanus TaxID=29151 RepID=UPI002E140C6B
MEKITEKLLLERCTPKTSKLDQIKTLNLSKLGLKSEDLSVPLLSRLKCLEQLDLSGNSLEEMPQGMCLPSLLKLDLSNNDLEDVTTLESLTSLEELKVEDNLYLTVNDNYKLMVLLPKMRVYNGKDISTTANHVRFIAGENLRTRVVAVWESDVIPLPNPAMGEEIAKVKRDFVKKAVHQVQYGPKSINGYTKWRVERIATEFFDSLIQPKDKTPKRKHSTSAADSDFGTPQRKIKVISQATVEASPRKSIRVQNTPQKVDRSTTTSPRKAVPAPATPSRVLSEDSPRKSNRRLDTPQKVDQTSAAGSRQAVQSSSTPTRLQPRRSETPRKALKEQQLKADTPPAKQSKTPSKTVHQHREVNGGNRTTIKNVYSVPKEPVSLKPHCALQCHSRNDSPDDLSTQLWACAFQPPPGFSASDASGESRIVATCGGDSVCLIDCDTGKVLKKHKVPGEEFFSLAWSLVLMSREGGGSVRPCRILAAGGKRGMVKLIHPRANLAYGEFRASRKAISILRFSPHQGNFLFTGTYDKRIVMWDIGGVDCEYNFKVIQLLMLEATSTPLHLCPAPSSPDTHLLAACEDGLHCYNIQLSKNTMNRSAEYEVTFPVYDKEDKDTDYHTIDGLAFLSDDIVASKSHMQGSIYLWSWRDTCTQRPSKKKQVCAVILAELQWANTDIPYLSLNTCPSKGYVVCGDDKGRLWRYHVTDLPKPSSQSRKTVPATEILELPVEDKFVGASINSVAMDPDLQYTVALTDKNIVVILKRDEC